MDRAVFLNSSGGIVDFYGNGNYIPSLKIAPYVETVAIPVVSVNSSALYGDHPENLTIVSCSSAAALTFFCDSVAGGSDTSGDGSFDNPWRSLNTASKFLSCASCTLNAAAEYIQLKIKGTVDYVSGAWSPFGYDSLRAGKLILRGWDDTAYLLHNFPRYDAGYFFDVRVVPGASSTRACSGCQLVSDFASSSFNIDCEFTLNARVSCAVNCSAKAQHPVVSASVFAGGTYAATVDAQYAYSMTVTPNSSGGSFYSSTAMYVQSCAVSTVVSGAVIVSGSSAAQVLLTGIVGGVGSPLLRDCIVDLTASAYVSGAGYVSFGGASVTAVSGDLVISGGTLTAYAAASAIAPYNATALAVVSGVGRYMTAAGVATNLTTSAGAKITDPDGREDEAEWVYNMTTKCYDSRVRYFSGGVVTSTYHSSGCSPW